jgi:bifunctional non-homologous end joining protein LigD
MGLAAYREKRNFALTSEPRGEQKRRSGNDFVVQKHDARSLHYDFRLELDGVLLSWSIPKGPSLDPQVKRLALQTEDHPLEYGDFEGVIPAGEYGGGTVLLWDRGTWTPEGDARQMYERGRLSFELHGQKLQGGFHLVRSGGRGKGRERSWLFFKSRDAAARPGSDAAILYEQPNSVASGRDLDGIARDPHHVWTSKKGSKTPKVAAREARQATTRLPGRSLEKARPALQPPRGKRSALPDFVEPELATLTSAAPEGADWLHEIKLDGYRLLVRIERGRAVLFSRRGNDWTARLPSIASALGALPVESALLDGELVALDERGASDFQRLQNSLDADKDVPLTYFAFDALYLDGFDLRELSLLERKARLREVFHAAQSPRLRLSDHVVGDGPAFFEQACKMGLEGIICKRADAPYVSGRGRAWLKVKCLSVQEFVIGGFTAPAGSRKHLGALLIGVREGERLVYAGKVGTGFTQASLTRLAAQLSPLERDTSPFANPPHGADARGVHWVNPELVAQVSFAERTRDGIVRHASFHGLRDDKAPEDVRMEKPEGVAKPVRRGKTKPPAAPIELDFSRLEVTHPDRILYRDQGISKRELMLYYASVARWMLPHVVQRPLMLLRCPEGEGEQCFHQKHPSNGMPKAVQEITVQQKKGPEPHLMIADLEGLLGLVQMGALEIHTWGCRAGLLACPDQLVFDLDPDVGLPWERVTEAAFSLRERLEGQGLGAFPKLTGGKGLHVVVPLEPVTPWEVAKQFAKSIADEMARAEPDKYLAVMTKAKRKGKLFIDYLRNAPGATAVCPFSTRARPGAPVAVPISWEELSADLQPDRFNVRNLGQRLKTLREDPWADFDGARANLAQLTGQRGKGRARRGAVER